MDDEAPSYWARPPLPPQNAFRKASKYAIALNTTTTSPRATMQHHKNHTYSVKTAKPT